MNPDARWQRATMLFQQGRHDMAATELRGVLTVAPDHAPAHALLALSLVHLDRLDEALAEAKLAIASAPELAFAHSAMAGVLWRRDEVPAAEAAIGRAIQLDPFDANHRSTLANLLLTQRRWQDALAAADAGLQIDPHETDCLNLRAIALTKLGRAAEATDSVDASLAHDPDNPWTHQARGFALLTQGDAKGALHHFQEALRRDPTLESSRQGLVEALKAQNPIYRLVLGWFLWLERFSTGRQQQILIGAWLASLVGSRALRDAGYTTAGTVVSFSWLGFVLLTACTVPIFNLLLLLHPLGRHALGRQQRHDAILLGATVLVAIVVVTCAFTTAWHWAGAGWFFWLLLPLPVAGLGIFHPGWARRVLQAFCLAVVGFWSWWAVQAHLLQRAALELVTAGDQARAAAELPDRIAVLKLHLERLDPVEWAIALSTWFVMLAPKGRPQRRRG